MYNEWISEFIECYFMSKDIEKFENALYLKQKHLPDVLYRYRCINGYSKDEIENDYVYLSPPKDFNDILDTASTVTLYDFLNLNSVKNNVLNNLSSILPEADIAKIACSEEYVHEVFRCTNNSINNINLREKHPAQAEEALRYAMDVEVNQLNNCITDMARKILKICCFTIDNCNTTMWSYYADNNRGICIEYDILNAYKIPFYLNKLYPVNYVEALPDYIEVLQKQPYSFQEYIAIHKTVNWLHEKEWRLIMSLGDFYYSPKDVSEEEYTKGYKLSFAPVKAIYLGIRISDKDKSHILEIARMKNIAVYQMKLKGQKLDSELII